MSLSKRFRGLNYAQKNHIFDDFFRFLDLVFGNKIYSFKILSYDLNEETRSTWLGDPSMKRATSSKSMKHIKGHPNRRFTGLDYVFRDLWENRSTKILSESVLEYLVGTCTLEQKVIVKDIRIAVLAVKWAYEPENVRKTLLSTIQSLPLTIPWQKRSSLHFLQVCHIYVSVVKKLSSFWSERH